MLPCVYVLSAQCSRLCSGGIWVCHVLIEIEIEIVTSKKYKYSRDVRLRTPQRTQKLAVVTIDKHKKYPVLVVIPPVTD